MAAIAAHPDLELTGLWVHSDSKAGRDAGEICGGPALGVIATNDADALLDSKPDAVCYMANSDLRPGQVIEDIAGMLRSGRTHEFSLDSWNQVIAVNLTGTFLMCRAALPHLIETKGSIVNAASTSSFFGHPWMGAYAASKGAILSFTQTLAVEYATVPVRANCVAPGSVHSGITSNVSFPDDLTKDEAKLIRRIMSPTGFGDPGDVGSVVALLLSDDGKNILIRPLAYCEEKDIIEYARYKAFPIIPCNLCGSQDNLQRAMINDMLRDWGKKYPGRLESIFTAVQNVAPSQLADRALFDFVSLKAEAKTDSCTAKDEKRLEMVNLLL